MTTPKRVLIILGACAFGGALVAWGSVEYDFALVMAVCLLLALMVASLMSGAMR